MNRRVKPCRHNGTWAMLNGQLNPVFRVCLDCRDLVSLGRARVNPHVLIEIAAARLIAGHETANDTDDTLADPIARGCIEHMIGLAELDERSEQALAILEAATEA